VLNLDNFFPEVGTKAFGELEEISFVKEEGIETYKTLEKNWQDPNSEVRQVNIKGWLVNTQEPNIGFKCASWKNEKLSTLDVIILTSQDTAKAEKLVDDEYITIDDIDKIWFYDIRIDFIGQVSKESYPIVFTFMLPNRKTLLTKTFTYWRGCNFVSGKEM
jgi:hypothetical protein